MADALETQVMLAARDSLLGILPADGYHTRPRVEMGAGGQPPTPLDRPTVLVHDAEGSRAERVIHYPPIWDHHLRFAVNCWTADQGEDGRTRALLNLAADVRRRLLRVDRTLGGLVQCVDEVDAEDTDEETAKPYGTVRIDFEARLTIEEEL